MWPEDFDQIENALRKALAYLDKARRESAKGWIGQSYDSLEAADVLLSEAADTVHALLASPTEP